MISSRKAKVISLSLREIEEQILDYSLGGERVITVADYWDRVFCKIAPEYSRYRFSDGARRVVCPFHDDVQPSMGIVYDKNGVEVFNCLGCHAKGTVVSFHIEVYKKFKHVHFKNRLDYLKVLASIYGLELTDKKREDLHGKNLAVDYSKPVPYSIRQHRVNIRKVKEAFSQGLIGIDDVRDNIAMLTEKFLEKNQKRQGS